MVCVPTAGLNVLPVTPIPLNVPPEGLPVKATGAALIHTAAYVPAFTTGNGLTIKFCVLLPTHPLVTVYVME